ncbi:MAG: alkyl sulfatase BDS1-like metallo-beta-lactamase superfamily hydrolase [Candidatus Azotimanducaceae bacterium]|jgi:alkyl sulfatase BDS1-like metallo-beta-lactamase superfamily hydrolase
MSEITLSASFGDIQPTNGPQGQLAHPATIEHTTRLERKLYQFGENAWCMVGNGLSNQSFVEGPEGLIVIDTGECVEEMQSALDEVRKFTSAPVVACIYTHFHYVNGTTALLEATADGKLEIYGHSGIAANRQRYGGEVGPRTTRGLVHQFGILLPSEGEDGLVNVGLGNHFRNVDHHPFTPGHMPASQTFDTETTLMIAGLEVTCTPAPSDASDSITIWFPQMELCINNILWPTLFNVFAIRGEEFRDPRVLLTGLDHLQTLGANYLLGAHGPPIVGKTEIAESVIDYRDSIQFLWDQTVRGVNKGLSLDELTSFVQLPERFERTYLTQQFYGVVEHHVKQIHAGLFGWFDEDAGNLFPMPPVERAKRLIDGFGGRQSVRDCVRQALGEEDFRWAIELANWLVKFEPELEDNQLLADGLRAVSQRTTAANIRNWCLTRVLELEGKLNLDRFRIHRIRFDEVMASSSGTFVPVLRVLLDPAKAQGMDEELCWNFDDGEVVGLKVRGQVAIPTTGAEASLSITLSQHTWANLLACKKSLSECIDEGLIVTENDFDSIKRYFSVFDVAAFQR